MICLECIGHEAEFELSNVIHLFEPYLEGEDYELKTIYELPTATVILYQSGQLIRQSAYKALLTGDEVQDKRAMKQALKHGVYEVLTQETKKTMPWGILTGIRPTKLVHEELHKGKSDEAIDAYLEAEYKVSPDKRQLMIAVAKEECAILKKNQPGEVNLYIGIPFCPTRCVYCSFTAYALASKGHLVEPYLEALFKEIDFVAEAKKGTPIRSLYIGGGTPTSLNEAQLERLLSKIEQAFDLSMVQEYTIEAGRPDTITEEKLHIMKAHGVGRISINPQSMNQKTLDVIGRKHTVEAIKEIFDAARRVGHNRINMDIILGLPGETIEDVAYTLSQLKKLGPENITVHTMAIKRASRLKEKLRNHEVETLTEGQVIEKMLQLCQKEIEEMGLHPYYMYRQKNMLGNFENVGYAKPDTECVYNVEIMEEAESIIALGAGAITKIVYQNGERIDRIANVKSLEDYIERIDEMIERKRVGFIKYK